MINDKLKRINYIFSSCNYEFDEENNTVYVQDLEVQLTFFSDLSNIRFNITKNFILDFKVDLSKCVKIVIADNYIKSLNEIIFPNSIIKLAIYCKKLTVIPQDIPTSINYISITSPIKSMDLSTCSIDNLSLEKCNFTSFRDMKFPKSVGSLDICFCNKLENLIGMPHVEESLYIEGCKLLLNLKGLKISPKFFSLTMINCKNIKSLKGLKINNKTQLLRLNIDDSIYFLDDVDYSDYELTPLDYFDKSLLQMELMIRFVRGEMSKEEYFKLYQKNASDVIDFINHHGSVAISLGQIETVAERIELNWD